MQTKRGSQTVTVAKDNDEVPGYTVLRVLGSSALANTYLAQRDGDDDVVAMKVLSAEFASASRRKEFNRHWLAAQKLVGQAHMLHVLESGSTYTGRPYVITRHCERGSLGDRLARGTALPVADALNAAVLIGRALHAAHLVGLCHRGVKPSNILLTADEQPLLSDLVTAAMRADHIGVAEGPNPTHTAPEVLADQPATPRSDIYSLASTVFHLLTGRPPHADRRDAAETLLSIMNDGPAAIGSADLPEALRAALSRALSVDPDARFPDALAFAEQLDRVLVELESPPQPGTTRSESPRNEPALTEPQPERARHAAPPDRPTAEPPPSEPDPVPLSTLVAVPTPRPAPPTPRSVAVPTPRPAPLTPPVALPSPEHDPPTSAIYRSRDPRPRPFAEPEQPTTPRRPVGPVGPVGPAPRVRHAASARRRRPLAATVLALALVGLVGVALWQRDAMLGGATILTPPAPIVAATTVDVTNPTAPSQFSPSPLSTLTPWPSATTGPTPPTTPSRRTPSASVRTTSGAGPAAPAPTGAPAAPLTPRGTSGSGTGGAVRIGFETGMDSWGVYWGYDKLKLSRTTSVHHLGSYALVLRASGTGHMAAGTQANLAGLGSGDRVTFHVYASGTGSGVVKPFIMDTGYTVRFPVEETALPSSAGWFTVGFTMPAGVAVQSIGLQFTAHRSDMWIAIDDLAWPA